MKPGQKLDFSSLKKACESLTRTHQRSLALPLDEELRDACIQRFEFSFELAWKMIRRRLERDLASLSQLDGTSFKEMMRLAFESGLIQALPFWWLFREMRNLSSHTYDAQVASRVYAVIVDFLPQCRFLIEQLERRGATDD
jgi:nucleotidyltransferase substrate binding protein (TIGR01987 family)